MLPLGNIIHEKRSSIRFIPFKYYNKISDRKKWVTSFS
ncbi:hypothetical protein C2W59_03115 [Bacillus pumilus]|nr:hypothetical protein B4129_0646 [Bacillus safensis]RAP22976.1 hypothetical protein C2W59_03115 [Bacillus pumilus]